MDRDVYEKMPEEVRENMTRENLEERSVSKQNISVLTLFASNDELTQAVRCFYVIAMKWGRVTGSSTLFVDCIPLKKEPWNSWLWTKLKDHSI